MKISETKAIVTGGASGMGRHFSIELARAGAQVAAFDLNEEGLNSLAKEAVGLPGRIHTFKVNVAKEADVVENVQKAWDAMGGITCLVNNAGIFKDGLLIKTDKATGKVTDRMSLANWQAVIDVDLTGPFLMTREVVARMIDAKTKGVIVSISSISRAGNPGQSNYSAAKAGLVADTKLWAQELARYGIRTGAIAPGFIRTPLLEGMRPEVLEKTVSGIPMRRLGEPSEIFAGVRFLIECDYFTGRCLDIDGGLVL